MIRTITPKTAARPKVASAMRGAAGTLALTLSWLAPAARSAEPSAPSAAAGTNARAADAVFLHGYIYTAEPNDKPRQAIAMRDGRFVFVGTDAETSRFVGPKTSLHDLHGGLLMPGLIDGHLHVLPGGTNLNHCDLNFESLTLDSLRARLQSCLDRTRSQEPDEWLQVANWYQQSMRPAGAVVVAADLDSLQTRRPIVVNTTFGHTLLLNQRALQAAKITSRTAAPAGGAIGHDSAGRPNGLLEDDARDLVQPLLPKPTPADDQEAVATALAGFAKQGITTFVDADSSAETIAAFDAVAHAGHLTARGYLIPQIPVAVAAHPDARIDEIVRLSKGYNRGKLGIAPEMRLQSAKIYLDGVIAGPSFTGAMLAPYLVDAGIAASPRWVPGTSRGPDPYFPPAALSHVVIELARNKIDPHMHVDGDRAVRAGLDAIEAMRRALPGLDIRPALAHDEIVDPADYPRFRALDVTPVLSMQWEKPAPDTIDNLRDYLGPERYARLEPAGFLAAAGARIAFGSDWPVDPLDEWFALKVGVTRAAARDAPAAYAGRLGEDPGLTVDQALRAITLNAAYEIHAERDIGSIAVGKLADFIVLDRNVLALPAAELGEVRVLETWLGGRKIFSREE